MPHALKEPLRILTTSPIFGYGFRLEDFWAGILKHKAHAIIVDAGSTDGGPYKLGLGKMTCSRESYLREFAPMVDACYHFGVKVIIGSAGGCGSNIQVDGIVEILSEVIKSKGYALKVATIKSDVERPRILQHLADGSIKPCGPAPELTRADVGDATTIVAQVGSEPFQKLLREHPDVDVIIAGRCYDPAPFAALAMEHGVDPGVAWHCGKIMECGGICATPKARSMLATLEKDNFVLTPLNDIERCTPVTVAAHALYEKTRPDILAGPGGNLLLSDVTYEQLDDGRSVRVSGAVFQPLPYTVKLEGAAHMGYRTIFIGGIRDPILISVIDEFLAECVEFTSSLVPELQEGRAQVIWHVYGKDAVMRELEPVKDIRSHELGILGEVIAPTQALATSIANNVRVGCLHAPYAGQLATAGNFAIPLTPHEQECGAVFKFSLYHLMPCEDPADWPIEAFVVGDEATATPKNPTFEPKIPPQPMKKARRVVKANVSTVTRTNTLRHLAKVVRSKNSGPFEITMDVMFETPEMYHHVKNSNVLNRELVKKLYNVADDHILTSMFFEPALAWKATIKRPWAQGSIGETDTLGTAQHAPLLDVEVPPFPSS